MKITKVMVNRKFNLGNYETLDLAAEAEINDTDNPIETWNILRDNIEMTAFNMQRKTATPPQQPPAPKPSPFKKAEPSNDGTKCPKCGATKKPQFDLCYSCHEEEKAT